MACVCSLLGSCEREDARLEHEIATTGRKYRQYQVLIRTEYARNLHNISVNNSYMIK